MIGKVIDVTYHGGREQREILKETDERVTSVSGGYTSPSNNESLDDSFVPEVVTYETIKDYCLNVIKNTPQTNQNKRRLFAGIIGLIDDIEELREENRRLKIEDLKKQDNEVIREIENEEDSE